MKGNHMNRILMRLLPLLGMLLFAHAASAAKFVTFDRFELHHNAVRSDFIPAEVAVAQGISRSASRGLVNIAILRRDDSGGKAPSEAVITLTVFNLAGQSQAVRMRAVREPDALYYIGEFRIAGIDTYRFEAEIEPAGAARAYSLRWSQELFAD
jgi:hypothetical protein